MQLVERDFSCVASVHRLPDQERLGERRTADMRACKSLACCGFGGRGVLGGRARDYGQGAGLVDRIVRGGG